MRTVQKMTMCLALASTMLLNSAFAESLELGEVEFPTSGAKKAQKEFIVGLLYLHSFEYGDAAEAFKRAQEIDPEFAMAYWGEAMTYNHPLWHQQAKKPAVDALRRLARTPEARQKKAATQREKDYLNAIEVLYGTVPASARLTKVERDVLYSEAMGRIQDRYADDLDAAAFYGLSILGTASERRNVATYMRAAASLYKVWDNNKLHPGGAHYLIHSYDDPEHAPLGLPMARAYSAIAPSAAHAQHMTSHIFVALGMWDDVVLANERAVKVVAENADTPPAATGHYPYWLMYGYLQQGRIDDAAAIMKDATELMHENPKQSAKRYFSAMRARYMLDTQDWDSAKRFDMPPGVRANESVHYFTSAFAAIRNGDIKEATSLAEMMQESEGQYEVASSKAELEVMKLEIAGLIELHQGKEDEGFATLSKAVDIADTTPYAFGPPSIVQPPRELLAMELLNAGRADEAVTIYKKQVAQTPRRVQSLLGLAKAQEASGNEGAAQLTYAELASIWHSADFDIDGYDEAMKVSKQ